MKVITEGGAVIEIGSTEAAPTIGIIDYSRRETDDFGVTTVVPRGFAREMSVRVKVPTANVDAVQRQLAALRATPAQWIADDAFAGLSILGFYKDFSIDLAIPPVSFCTLTIEGLAEEAAYADPGTDPAPDQRASTLRLLQPMDVTDTMLVASNVPETDYAEWSAGATYALGARVIRAASHRIYESAADGNSGNDPVGDSGLWLDIGPTNRWAMFDQALGSLTEKASPIIFTIDPPSAINALALLDVTAASVRVQAAGYDRTQVPPLAPGMVTFADLPDASGPVIITLTGSGTVSVGTLLIGRLLGLGITEASPTAAITDYSRKETDDFGEVTLVERAWAKRMSVRGMIRTSAVDIVAGRIANVRARPCLWIGDAALESVTVYGFFKDFSIEVGDAVSFVSLSVEGLSKAAKPAPLGSLVEWPDIADPDGTKPEDNATYGAPADAPVADGKAQDVLDALKALGGTTDPDEIVQGALDLIDRSTNQLLAAYNMQLLAEERKQRFDELLHLDGAALRTRVWNEITERIEGEAAMVVRTNGIEAAAADGINAAMATIEQTEIVLATAISAETVARQQQISQLVIDIDGDIAAVQAAIVAEQTTRAAADLAEATAREALAASIATDLATVNAAILTEQTVRAAADEAEATARQALAVTLAGDIGEVAAAVETEAIARAAEDGALASALTAVETTVDGHTAQVAMLLESVDGLNARWGVRLSVDGYITGVVMNNDGEEGSFDVLADNFRVVSPDGGDRYEYSDGTQRIIAGSVMTVTGVAFGSSGQFIRWTGPIQSSLSGCTEANAIEYVKIDGSAYFAGSLSSGTLKNEGTSTTVSPTAFIIVGPFMSNGGPINVNMSALFRHSYQCNPGTGSISGSGSGALELGWSSDGSTWNTLTTIGANETDRTVRVDGDPTVPDAVNWEMGAASTFTWTPGALSGVWIRLRWTSQTQPTLGGTGILNNVVEQRTTIIAIEQP